MTYIAGFRKAVTSVSDLGSQPLPPPHAPTAAGDPIQVPMRERLGEQGGVLPTARQVQGPEAVPVEIVTGTATREQSGYLDDDAFVRAHYINHEGQRDRYADSKVIG